MSYLTDNLRALYESYPDLAEQIEDFPDPDRVCVSSARDGGVAYGLKQAGTVVPLTDPDAPLTRMRNQLDRAAADLTNLSKPVLVVGFHPGAELLYIFDLGEQRPAPHAPQAIYVCVDSLPCLLAFMQTYDARTVIASPRVRFFWHEDTPAVIDALRARPELPHTFTLISGATNIALNRIMPPFAALTRERKEETLRLQTGNEAHYNTQTDAELTSVIGTSAPPLPLPQLRLASEAPPLAKPSLRRPRLLMPTCSWSTVTQYSARDMAAAFESLGWVVRHLNVDAMLTPYCVARVIHEFKPDVFLFINHLRSEALPAYPRNMMFVTWIQDTLPKVNQHGTADVWNQMALSRPEAPTPAPLPAAGGTPPPPATAPVRKRDLLIGYVDQLRKYGYAPGRLIELPMMVNHALFKPRSLTASQQRHYGCDIMFASNRSTPTDRIVKEELTPLLAPHEFHPPALLAIHDHLWARYRAGATFTSFGLLEAELRALPAFREPYDRLAPPDRDQVIQALFWRLNDVIYRHVVLEWIDADCSAATDRPPRRLHLHGHGWENHPRFAKYTRGEIAHGTELSIAYQAARYALHLNTTEGQHQRLNEIAACGGTVLSRSTRVLTPAQTGFGGMLNKVAAFLRGNLPELSLTAAEQKSLTHWGAAQLKTRAEELQDQAPDAFLAKALARLVATQIPTPVTGVTFATKADLLSQIGSPAAAGAAPAPASSGHPSAPNHSPSSSFAAVLRNDLLSFLSAGRFNDPEAANLLSQPAIRDPIRTACSPHPTSGPGSRAPEPSPCRDAIPLSGTAAL